MANNNIPTFVTVACKLPHGLVLQLARPEVVSEPVMGGGSRQSKQFRQFGEQITVHGVSHPQNAAPKAMIVGGYALTNEVSGQFWFEWLAQNKEHAAVKNHLLFAYEKEADAKDDAKDHAKVRSGLERLDPKKLPGKLVPLTTVKATEEST